jgi:hypothetical protein
MVTSRQWVGLFLMLAVAAGSAEASGQLVSVPNKPRLSLGISAGAPEAETEVSMKLASPVGTSVGRIEAVVSFPISLEFKDVTGAAITQRTLKVDRKLSEPEGGRRSVALVIQSETAGQPLARETIVNLVFTVAKDTAPGVLDVNLQGKIFSPSGDPIPTLEVYSGRVNIQTTDVFTACFFYMH